jgi:hypothetical protein
MGDASSPDVQAGSLVAATADASATTAVDDKAFVCPSRFGPILIEIRHGVAYVNGAPVEPLAETLRSLGDHALGGDHESA